MLLSFGDQTRNDRVPFDVTPNPVKLGFGSYQVIVTFFLPKGLTAGARMQQPIHGHECLSRAGHAIGRKHSMRGKTAVQTKSNKQRLIDCVPMENFSEAARWAT
jgi:hypothetical protein